MGSDKGKASREEDEVDVNARVLTWLEGEEGAGVVDKVTNVCNKTVRGCGGWCWWL